MAQVYFDGAYRTHDSGDISAWTELATEAFPRLRDRIACFASDWLGRQFAVYTVEVPRGQPTLLMLDPGTGKVGGLHVSLEDFHETELHRNANQLIGYGTLRQWLASGQPAPRDHQCAGQKVPVFLGGTTDIGNLELIDMNVYWTIHAQLLAQTRDLPEGTRVRGVSTSD